MKLQFEPGSMRVRISEAELAALLRGEALHLRLDHGDGRLMAFRVALDDIADQPVDAFRLDVTADAGCRLVLDRDFVQAYARTLPRRDALTLPITPPAGEGALQCLLFEVDVRDSIRTRGAAPRAADTARG